MNVSVKEPVFVFSASSDQVTVQLLWHKAKEPEASSSKATPALKKNKPHPQGEGMQNVMTSVCKPTSAEVIPKTISVDQNHQTEAKTSLEGNREITPTKYEDEPEGIVNAYTIFS